MNDCTAIPQDFLSGLRQWAKTSEIPLSMTFELTPMCNFNCVMCYVRQTPEQTRAQGGLIPAAKWLEIARQARDMGTLYLTLTGGEPLTHPEFWEIYKELNQMGFMIHLLSNGSLIDEAAMEKFQRYGLPCTVKLTLYGASDETYLRTCGCADGFTRVSHAIDLLEQAGIPLQMTSTIVRENADDLQQMYRFARERRIPFQHTVSVVKSSRGAINTAETSRFPFEEFEEELTLEGLEKSKFPPLPTPFAWCVSFGASLWFAWNGNLQLCSFMNIPAVPYSGNLSEDWKKLMGKGHGLKSPEECANCKWSMFCQRCPGMLCAESGHPERIDPDLCRTAENLYHIYHKLIQQEVTK